MKQTGYGVIQPMREEIRMEEPVVIRQGNRYGVKIKASAPSIHLIRADIETEIAPIVGSESQAGDLINYMKENSGQEEGAGSTLIFGKSVDQMVEEGIQTKISAISEECQMKLQDTIETDRQRLARTADLHYYMRIVEDRCRRLTTDSI